MYLDQPAPPTTEPPHVRLTSSAIFTWRDRIELIIVNTVVITLASWFLH